MLRARLLCVAALAALAALVGSACVPSEDIEPLAKDYPSDTAMGAIQSAGVLRVGLPGVPELDAFAGALAQRFADLLDVELTAIEMASDEVHLRLGDGSIDIGFPLKPLTEQVVRRNTVTDPYLLTFQRVLSRPGSIVGPGIPTCILSDGGITVEVGGAMRTDRDTCVSGLLSGELGAATGLDVELVAVQVALTSACRDAAAEDGPPGCSGPPFAIGGDQLAAAGLGAFVEPGASEMVAFVERAVAEYIADGSWLGSWTTVYGTYYEAPASPPNLSAEEAAALYPTL